METDKNLINTDLLALVRGKKIGTGSFREVYTFLPDPSLVIKEEVTQYKFDNITEWEVWQSLKDTPYRDWLARCRTISPNGLVLVQERTERVPEAILPRMIPSIFADTKADNWGMVTREGKQLFVCHDYAHSRCMNVPSKIRLVKAKWHNPDYQGWL